MSRRGPFCFPNGRSSTVISTVRAGMGCDGVVLVATRREERPIRLTVRRCPSVEAPPSSLLASRSSGFALGILGFAAPDPCRTSWDWLPSLLGVPSC